MRTIEGQAVPSSAGFQPTTWTVVADDLTGAADCAVAFAEKTQCVVTWARNGTVHPLAENALLAIDADSRSLSASSAAEHQAEILARFFEPDKRLFKKIDSTLRGQPAAEVAAAIAHLRNRDGRCFGVLAPAFPATGRTTRDGHILVNGAPLKQFETWRREHTYPSADLIAVLASAGVVAETVPLATVRAGDLEGALIITARKGDRIAVCDAETDDDLKRIAAASLSIETLNLLIGSAGLAHALAAIDDSRDIAPPAVKTSTLGTLMVVGSAATTSRKAARTLAAETAIVHIGVPPELLRGEDAKRSAVSASISQALASGRDVLVELVGNDDPPVALDRQCIEALAEFLAPVVPHIGALAATGGETAAALLSRFGVNAIRVVGEVDRGIPLGLTIGEMSVPIATKAGAFGDDNSFVRISERLHAIKIKGSFQ